MARHPRIEINPDVMVGKPVIKGTRITVEHILRRLADYDTMPEFLGDYPNLTAKDVRAALAYAADQLPQRDKERAA